VLDPGFKLHVREDRVATAWVVRKPTASGTITSLEVFDAFGETVLMLFARRDDRAREEEPAWWPALLAAQEAGA
jgi:putative hemin transport protein